jgi:hypothetical protein
MVMLYSISSDKVRFRMLILNDEWVWRFPKKPVYESFYDPAPETVFHIEETFQLFLEILLSNSHFIDVPVEEHDMAWF